MAKIRSINYRDRLSNQYFIDNNINKAVFLDIDGVIQPQGSNIRYEHW